MDQIVAAVRYDVRARPFLLRAKDHRRPELLAPLGRQLATAVTLAGFVDRVDLLVPVPSSKMALWRRGFDPAAKLAVEVALLTGLPVGRSLLKRRSFAGPPAKGLGAAARWRAAERSVVASENAVDMRILLIDDVLTTGATAAACARALREAGAREVRAAVWARTPAPFGHL